MDVVGDVGLGEVVFGVILGGEHGTLRDHHVWRARGPQN